MPLKVIGRFQYHFRSNHAHAEKSRLQRLDGRFPFLLLQMICTKEHPDSAQPLLSLPLNDRQAQLALFSSALDFIHILWSAKCFRTFPGPAVAIGFRCFFSPPSIFLSTNVTWPPDLGVWNCSAWNQNTKTDHWLFLYRKVWMYEYHLSR